MPEVFAPAKLNLFLHVGEKRPDGFHALESLVVFADIGDRLRIEAAEDFSLTLDGPFGFALADEADNLIARAARALAAKLGRAPGARIVLTKNLPVSSGIGGGSADAAAALRGLAQLWNAPAELLGPIAESLGSDVPACLASRTLWMTGRGEGIEAVDGIPSAPLLLVNPGVAVPTGPIFGALTSRSGVGQAMKPARSLSVGELADYLKGNRNDLETPAREIQTVIGEVIAAIADAGALTARMSGSGATCFGLFADETAMERAASRIAEAQPGWWVKTGRVL